MNRSSLLSRRRFLQTSLLASGALAGSNLSPMTVARASAAQPPRDPFRGLKLGITSYTFHKFTLDQAIKMTKEAGVKYFSIKDTHLPLKSSRAKRQEARKKVEDAGLILMGGGVIYFKN